MFLIIFKNSSLGYELKKKSNHFQTLKVVLNLGKIRDIKVIAVTAKVSQATA